MNRSANRLVALTRPSHLAGLVVLPALLGLAIAGSARAQTPDQEAQPTRPATDSVAETVRLAQDPLAKIRSFGTDTTFESGSGRPRYSFQMLPLYEIPTRFGFDILTRGIIPITGAPTAALDGAPATAWGLGDITVQAVLVPRTKSPIEFGFGPQVSLRTRTDDAIGGAGWGGGVVGIVFGAGGPISYGAITGHHWAGATFCRTSIQPILILNTTLFGRGSYVGYRHTISYSWKGAGDKKWVVPVGVLAGRTFTLSNGYIIDVNVGGYYLAAQLAGQADRQLKIGLSVLFR